MNAISTMEMLLLVAKLIGSWPVSSRPRTNPISAIGPTMTPSIGLNDGDVATLDATEKRWRIVDTADAP